MRRERRRQDQSPRSVVAIFAGRGLRRAELTTCARVGGAGGFALSIEIEEDGATHQLGSAFEQGTNGDEAGRRNRIDRMSVASSRAFCDHVRLVWLTPAMDSLFAGPASERRRFPSFRARGRPQSRRRGSSSSGRCAGRNRLLEEGARNASWLAAIEREAAELGVAVAAARLECVSRLDALIAADRDDASPFPWAKLALEGEVEALTASRPALEAEDRYRAILRDNRGRDAAAGRTLIGPHLGDLSVWHGPKQAPAASASTGEQKALIVGLALAHARLVAEMSGIAPLALLDEIAAHFDPRRRAALFEALERVGGQVFLTLAPIPRCSRSLRAGRRCSRSRRRPASSRGASPHPAALRASTCSTERESCRPLSHIGRRKTPVSRRALRERVGVTGQSGEVNLVKVRRAPAPRSPSRDGRPSGRPVWGQAGVGGRAALSEEGRNTALGSGCDPP